MIPILDVQNLTMQFGGLKALDAFQIKVNKGELVGLIGPNGAGKTTVFNLLTGVYRATDGIININGINTKFKKPNEIVLLGGSRTFQNIRLFKNLTVLDNIRIAYHNHMSYRMIEGVLKTRRYRNEEAVATEKALELLSVFEMEAYKNDLAKNLPYGKQRKLEIARALATKPKILLLDEPAAGMNPIETVELMHTIKMIKDRFDVSILLIEHDMKLVMGICERIVVLDYGKVIASGLPHEIRSNPLVVKAYLGE
jgi:branched-chain amino acid transport system ATP-binding protein